MCQGMGAPGVAPSARLSLRFFADTVADELAILIERDGFLAGCQSVALEDVNRPAQVREACISARLALGVCRSSAEFLQTPILHCPLLILYIVLVYRAHLLNMVVLNATHSTSELNHKKNRRKMSKKPAQIAPVGAEDVEDQDQEMDEQLTVENAEDNAEPPPETNWNDGDDEVMIDSEPTAPPQTNAPTFPPLPASAQRSALKSEIRRVPVPPHRMTPLKKDWVNIFSPLTEMLQLQVRMNVQRKCVEIRVSAI